MTDRLKTISLRQFRERAGEIMETVDIAVRDGDGNLRIIGYFTPYATYAPGATPLEPLRPSAPLEIPVEDEEPGPRIIRTPQEAETAVQPVRPFTKAEQAGRKRGTR